MPIRALLMDIDDTLFDFQTSSRNALSIAFRALNLPFTLRISANWVRSAILCRTANRRCGSCTRSTKFLS